MSADHTPIDPQWPDETPSKTRLKQLSHELQALGESAVALPDDDTVQIPVAKLLDPDTETTLTLPIPRQRAAAAHEGMSR